MPSDLIGQWFYAPDLATWGQIHVSFSDEAAQKTDAAELSILKTILPEGAVPLAVDLGGNCIVEEANGRITYFDSSGYHHRYESGRGSLVYPVSVSRDVWVSTLKHDVEPKNGSRAWRLAFADSRREGGTRREEMWYFPEPEKAQCIERTVFLEFCPAEYEV